MGPDPLSEQRPIPFHVRVGRRQGVRPFDLVGMLCKEVGLPNEAIGAIDIGLNNSEIWVGGPPAEELAKMGWVPLRGRPVPIRRADGLAKDRPRQTPPRPTDGPRPHPKGHRRDFDRKRPPRGPRGRNRMADQRPKRGFRGR